MITVSTSVNNNVTLSLVLGKAQLSIGLLIRELYSSFYLTF